MEIVDKETARRLNELKFVAQYIYTRFCQANTFTGRLAEAIVIDIESINNDILKFKKIGGMTIDYLLSEYGEATNTKKERFESVVHICDTYLDKMKQILLAAKKEVKNADDQMVIQKCDITVEQGLRFIEALRDLRQTAEDEI